MVMVIFSKYVLVNLSTSFVYFFGCLLVLAVLRNRGQGALCAPFECHQFACRRVFRDSAHGSSRVAHTFDRLTYTVLSFVVFSRRIEKLLVAAELRGKHGTAILIRWNSQLGLISLTSCLWCVCVLFC